MVWFATGLPFFMNFFAVMYLVGIYSSGCPWTSGSRCTVLAEHDFIPLVDRAPAQLGRRRDGPDGCGGSSKTEGLLGRRVQ